MRINRRTAMVVAILCAAGAALLTAYYLQSLSKPAPPPEAPKVMVPVPNADLAAGTRISSEKLTTLEFPQDQLPEGAITVAQELQGQILTEAAPARQPIRRSQLAAHSPLAGLAYVVPDGMRAVTVAVDNVTGVGGFLKLSDRVDVLANFEVGPEVVTRTVLQDVEVLGVGAEAMTPASASASGTGEEAGAQAAPPPDSSQAQKLPSVTLAVTPEQAQKLILAAQRGRLHLSLRPTSDSVITALSPDTSLTVIGPQMLVPLVPPGAGGAAPAGGAVSPPPPGTPPPAAGAAGALGQPGAPGLQKTGPSVEVIRGTTREVVVP